MAKSISTNELKTTTETNHENTLDGSSFVVSGSYTIFAAVLSNSVSTNHMIRKIKVRKLAVSQLPKIKLLDS